MSKTSLSWFNPIHWLALGFGSGLAPKAPGTFGTLVGIPVVFLMAQLNWWEYLLALVVMTLAVSGSASIRLRLWESTITLLLSGMK